MQNLQEIMVNKNKLRSLNYLALPNFMSLRKLNASYNQIEEGELDNIAHVTL